MATIASAPAATKIRTPFLWILMFLLAMLLTPLAAAQKSKDNAYKKTYASDMEAFLKEAQINYPFFDLKGLRKEWKSTRKDLEKRAKKCKTDAEFIGLVWEGIKYLRDAHMYLTECKVEMPRGEPSFYTGISLLPATEGRVIVMYPPDGQGASLKPGSVVLTINGKDARKFLDARGEDTWEKGGGFSSPQRATLFEYRTALSDERGEKYELVCMDGKKRKRLNCHAAPKLMAGHAVTTCRRI
jgi:hypothetical protein